MKEHFDALRYANLNSAVVSWWGQNKQSESTRLPMILKSAAAARLRIALYYEKEGFANPGITELSADLDYVMQNYTSAGNYLKRNGKPVILAFGDRSDNCDTVRRWHQASGGRFFVVLKVFTGYRTCPQQPDGWHQYGPAVAQDHQAGRSSHHLTRILAQGESARALPVTLPGG